MKLATLKNGSRDGRLVVVSRDLQTAVDAVSVAATMQFAIEHWDCAAPGLKALGEALDEGRAPGTFTFDLVQAMSPLPRSYQLVDASAFLNHGNITERAFNLTLAKRGQQAEEPRRGRE